MPRAGALDISFKLRAACVQSRATATRPAAASASLSRCSLQDADVPPPLCVVKNHPETRRENLENEILRAFRFFSWFDPFITG